MSKRNTIFVSVFLMFAIVIAVYLLTRESGPVVIDVELPPRYSGIARINFRRGGGSLEVWRGNKVFFVLPPSGILDVAGESPATRWHVLRVHLGKKSPLPEGNLTTGALLSNGTVGVWRFSLSGEDEGLFIGTTVEATAFANQLRIKQWQGPI